MVQIGTQRCNILTFQWIALSHGLMQQTTEIDDALGDDRLGDQVVLDVTYRYSALHDSFGFPGSDALLLNGTLFLP